MLTAARRRGVEAAVHATSPSGVDTWLGQKVGFCIQVGGGDAQGAAALARHATTRPVSSKGRPRSMAAPSTRPSSTNSRILVDEQTSPATMTGGTMLTPMCRRAPSLASSGRVALPAGPKSEIPAHYHVAGVEVPAQYFGDEAIGGQSRKFGGEGLDHDRIRTCFGKQFQTTFQRHQHGRRQRGCQESRRMGIEGQNHGLTACRMGEAGWRWLAKPGGRDAHHRNSRWQPRARAGRAPGRT